MSSNDNSAQKKAGSVAAVRPRPAKPHQAMPAESMRENNVQPVPDREGVGTRHVDEQLSMDRLMGHYPCRGGALSRHCRPAV